MSNATHLEAISAVESKIAEHHDLVRDYARDVTLSAAKDALAQATAAKVQADQEDESVDPAELVDRRIEAARQVEVAKIRLERAERALGAQAASTLRPLEEARDILVDALKASIAPLAKRLEEGARSLFGEEIYLYERSTFESFRFRVTDQVSTAAKNLMSPYFNRNGEQWIAALNAGIRDLREATRER